MARKDEQGLMQATAEDLTVLTPETVPEWVDCFVSKRQILGEQARYVTFRKGKNVWIHKRFLGEFDVVVDEDDEVANEFEAEYAELELEAAEAEGDEAEGEDDGTAASPTTADETTPAD